MRMLYEASFEMCAVVFDHEARKPAVGISPAFKYTASVITPIG